MAVYLIEIFLILILSTGFHPEYSNKGKKQFLVFTFLLLTIVSGIRGYTVGADTPVYVKLFQNIDYVAINNPRYEPGFIVYLKALHSLSGNPTFLLFVSSAICIGTYCAFTNAFSKKPTISMLLYITLGAYFSQMNTMRQSLALSFTAIAFIFVLGDAKSEREYRARSIISALFVLLSVLFHTITVIVFVPWLLIVRQGKTNEESKLTMQYAVFQTFIIAIIGYVFYSLVMQIASAILPVYTSYFRGTWSDSNYFASLLKTLIYVAFLVAGAAFINRRRLTYLQRFGVIMLCLSSVFSVLSMRMEIWERIAGIFGIYTYLIWVPELLTEIKRPSNRRIIEAGIFLFSLAYMIIVLVFRPEWSRVVPYVVQMFLNN